MSVGDAIKGFRQGLNAIERPEIVTDEHLEYLDDLRADGSVNMFAAGHCLVDEFDLSDQDSRTVLGYWMRTFGKDSR